ncbi:MAG TPA: acetyl-CoA carboxylase biotin carboxyl carrier protein subunit [Chitinophagales bacterium]|nr:acetyl-CoA carboxylase biotin carboxyl carrier protein subunit [Chitinophagales bacterium]HMW94652.1 acetyl-CoA carboxylase biotin carboxyl carrier protein subunit [Chitinophagales bacterium]HMY43397.1 acetyl-CoA carboxylase biotin carboxyl carrier protein subunit [Chitinophagales bacterium]HMZ93782.1 acetyl-CoA carboxylase biotin carboxyl carrier protein subunit [Chitinophagales bacterium]HNC65134.1 acetyl-CoA carboxylase biotin carboxyl carrier protein subunit [Chitinophagales bacterium]
MKYNIIYNENKAHEIELKDNKIIIDGQNADIDLVHIYKEKYHIIDNNESFNIEVVRADFQNKTFEIKVNDTIYPIQLEDELDMLLEKMGMSAVGSNTMDNVKAPMPGLVLRITVDVGQEVNKGDNLIVLEAMKMENIIKATGTGKVKNILVTEKQAVEKNQLLIEME